MKPKLLALAFAGALAGAPLVHAQSPGGQLFAPKDIKWAPLPGIPGAQIAVLQGSLDKPGPFVARVKYPANVKIAPHTHPIAEHLTVISGTLYLGMGDRFDRSMARRLPAGGYAFVPPDTPNFIFTKGETIVQGHGVGPYGVKFLEP